MIACWAALALAQAPPESRAAAVQPVVPLDDGWRAFALFQARGTTSDLAATNPLLDGQVVGRLGGTNGIVVDPEQTAAYTEQRVSAFATYHPPLLAGAAGLTAAFEVDFAYGDRAYGTGGNVGGGFGGDQVNLQTRRLFADATMSHGGHDAHVVLGLQFVGDSVSDPTTATPDQLLRSGGRLAFFGSEAAGLAVYGRVSDAWGTRLRYRIGAFTLLEQGLSLADDVLLAVSDVEVRPAFATHAGLHFWYLQDRSGGTGGALGIGPTSDLYTLQGGGEIDLYDGLPPPDGATVDADLVWAGIDTGFNAPLDHGPVGLHASAVLNAGRIYAPVVHDDGVLGAVIDAEGRLRWARGSGSVLRAEGLIATGSGGNPDQIGSVVTGNAYGIAGAPMPTHGTLLLFPDGRAINRMVAVVPDLSGAGLGILGASASAGFDPVPGRLNTTVGLATATTAQGAAWGTELNARVSGEPVLFFDLGLMGAVLLPGPASELTASPWAMIATVDWLVL